MDDLNPPAASVPIQASPSLPISEEELERGGKKLFVDKISGGGKILFVAAGFFTALILNIVLGLFGLVFVTFFEFGITGIIAYTMGKKRASFFFLGIIIFTALMILLVLFVVALIASVK